ncbi:MAG TPA: DinB family protein [Candidatus Acidoferrum sp.]|nr:DinB family protein [Candidatus Acidoferrum sp.]
MQHVSSMARFNAWVNERLYGCVAQLDETKYRADYGLFFGSIHATLNHLLVVDRLWTGRVQGIDRGIRSLDQILYDDLPALQAARRQEDADLIGLMDRLTDTELQSYKRYSSADRSKHMETRVWDMLTGMFNHQTHHRGQIYAVLLQQGMKLPDIDVIYYLIETGQSRYVP